MAAKNAADITPGGNGQNIIDLHRGKNQGIYSCSGKSQVPASFKFLKHPLIHREILGVTRVSGFITTIHKDQYLPGLKFFHKPKFRFSKVINRVIHIIHKQISPRKHPFAGLEA